MIFTALVEMHVAAAPIDIVVVRHELERRGELESVGGIEYVAGMLEVPSAANAEYYAGIVKDKARLRQAIRIGQEIINAAGDVQADADQVYVQAREHLDGH